MKYAYLTLLFLIIFALSLFGIRGVDFTKPPLDVFPEWAFPGMKYQPKYKPQNPSPFFADGRADRPLPPGTVASGYGPAGQALRTEPHRYAGKTAGGEFARGFPPGLAVDLKLLQRGRERFTIYCAPCHGALGDGQGITKTYGMGATPTYHQDRIRLMAEGEIFNTITHGKNTMMAYADKLTPDERWAVIAYVRALQRARMGTLSDVPADHRKDLEKP